MLIEHYTQNPEKALSQYKEAVAVIEEELRANGNDLVVIPKSDAQISALLEVLPLQLLSYYMSVMRGFDPDFPRNLSKTVRVDLGNKTPKFSKTRGLIFQRSFYTNSIY